ncbi:MAG: penicillin-insensitive murein endopeptidase [Chloroflexota bacterium]|nr:penicillin-insensitive murein endopeptidase [Chloroflexota bacterium]
MVVAQRIRNHAVENESWQGETDRRSPDYVRWVQEALNRVNGAGLTADGRFGPRSRTAVQAFQRRQGLPADGVVGPLTEAALVAAGATRPPSAGSTPRTVLRHRDVVVPLSAPGPGYYAYKPADNQFGLAETIRALQAIGLAWSQARPSSPRIGVGDISLRGGGPIRGHVSHQRGLDVDIRLIRGDGREAGVRYQDAAYSRELTQDLTRRIHGNGVLRVQYIFFNDPSVSGVRRWPNHDDHLHVRFYPPGTGKNGETDNEAVGEIDRRSAGYVSWVQDSLNRVNGAGLTVDGRFGPKSRAAVQAFQRRQGLPADGVVGPLTEAALVAAGAPPPGAGSSSPIVPPPIPAPKTDPQVAQACPEPARLAVDRCLHPGTQTCPAIPNLLCLQAIEGVPFEYPMSIGRDPGTGLRIVSNRQSSRTQRFVPAVRDNLTRVVADLRRFGLPIEAILTQGSLYCRCTSNTDTLSNHSFGDAIDIAGVRWPTVGGPASRLRETIVHNFADQAERALLRRINACLRLSFATVIDYNYNAAHQDHFHCDTNRGRGRRLRGKTTTLFTQEALSHVLGQPIALTGRFDAATERGLSQFSNRTIAELTDDRVLNEVLDSLYTRIAAGR